MVSMAVGGDWGAVILKTTNGMWKPGYNNNNPVDMTKEVSMIFYIEKELNKPTVELFKEWAAVSFRKQRRSQQQTQRIRIANLWLLLRIQWLYNTM